MGREFTYVAPPTGLAFHNAAPGTYLYKGIRGVQGCLPGYTEVMTPKGWIRIDEYESGTPILQWESGGTAKFVVPQRHVVRECDRFMVFESGSGKRLRMSVTSDHRVPLYDWRGRFVVKSASELARRLSRHVVPTTWDSACGGVGMTDGELRLWVMVAADGYYPKRGRQCTLCFGKQRKVERAEWILGELGISYSKRVSCRSDGRREVVFAFNRPSFPKHFDWRLASCSRHQAEVVTDEVRYWDGLYDGKCDEFYTSCKTDRDVVQYLAHCCGRNTTLARRDADGNRKEFYRVSIAKRGSMKGRVGLRCDGTDVFPEPAVDGKCYCFTTDTGFFVVRQHGRIFITGNSGKTTVCHQDIVMKSHMQPPILDPATGKLVRWTRWGMFRDTFQALMKTTIPDWLDWHPIGESMTMHWSPPINGVYEIPSMRPDDREKNIWVRIELMFYASGANTFMNDIDGLSLSGAYFNEAAAQSWEAIHKVQERVGRFKPPGASAQGWKGLSFGVLMDTNTPTDSSWWYRLEQVVKPARMLWFVQPPPMIRTKEPPPRGCTGTKIGDVYYIRNDEAGHEAFGTSGVCENIENLQDGWDYYEKQLVGADEDYIKMRLLNEYGKVKAGQPVWPGYIDAVHSTDDELEHERGTVTLVGMDLGGSPAAAICQMTRMGQLRVLGEEVAFHKMVPPFVEEQLIPRLMRDFNWPMTPAVIFPDPSGKNLTEMNVMSAHVFLQSKGFEVRVPPELSRNDVLTRITAVDALLRQIAKGPDGKAMPKFMLSRKCEWLRKALNGGYCYRKLRTTDGSERYEDKPDKDSDFSHIADALQYVACGATSGGGGLEVMRGRMSGSDLGQPWRQRFEQRQAGPTRYFDFGCA